MSQGTKFCKHCGQIIDSDCVVCPKCGKQVENLNSYGGNGNGPIIINNNNKILGLPETKLVESGPLH